MTALHFAANAGHVEVVKVLIGANANLNAVDEVSSHLCTVQTYKLFFVDSLSGGLRLLYPLYFMFYLYFA